MKKSAIYLTSILLLIITSCGKEKTNNEQENPTIFDLLTAHDWQGVEVIRYVNGQASTHTPITDTKYVFETDYHYQKIENNAAVQDGTWEWLDGTSQIRLRYFDASLNHNILDDLNVTKITTDKLEYFVPVIDGSNNLLRDDFYFKK